MPGWNNYARAAKHAPNSSLRMRLDAALAALARGEPVEEIDLTGAPPPPACWVPNFARRRARPIDRLPHGGPSCARPALQTLPHFAAKRICRLVRRCLRCQAVALARAVQPRHLACACSWSGARTAGQMQHDPRVIITVIYSEVATTRPVIAAQTARWP